MYDIEYAIESNTFCHHVNSNHLPQIDDDITIDGKHFKVRNIRHILNTERNNTTDEKFVVEIQLLQ